MKQRTIILFFTLLTLFQAAAQEEYLNKKAEVNEKIYTGGIFHEVKSFPEKFRKKKPKNVIFFIVDGMSLPHLHAAMTANKGSLYVENFKKIGFAKTHSANNYITDSAAGGTALSTGEKTNNGAIGVGPDKKPLKTILEEAEDKGLATGLVSTSAITHATPASFIAHQPSRNMYEEIADDFLKTDIDVFIGGGYKHFTQRKDGRDLTEELKQKGYRVEQDMDVIQHITSGKLAGLTAKDHNGRIKERGDMLPLATNTAINILINNRKGFFLMVEASQIDWGGHAGSTIYVAEEMLDFDRTVGVALEFAAKNKQTLIVITSDHETGGMTILNGDYKTGMVQGEFTTGGHTGLMVPVLAWGPGAEEFSGFMENTEIKKKISKLLIAK